MTNFSVAGEIEDPYYDGNHRCQFCHSRESGNPGLDWMPDRACPGLDPGSGMTTFDMFTCRSNKGVAEG